MSINTQARTDSEVQIKREGMRSFGSKRSASCPRLDEGAQFTVVGPLRFRHDLFRVGD